MFGTYLALQSVMFERSSLLVISKPCACINSPVDLPPVIAEENAQQPCLFLFTFLFTKI